VYPHILEEEANKRSAAACTLAVARTVTNPGRAPGGARFFNRNLLEISTRHVRHLIDVPQHHVRRSRPVPPTFRMSSGDGSSVCHLACMHAGTSNEPLKRRSGTQRRCVNRRGRPVVVVHGEANTGGRNKTVTRTRSGGDVKADRCSCLNSRRAREISGTGEIFQQKRKPAQLKLSQ